MVSVPVFIATLMPLIALSSQCLVITITTTAVMRNAYFRHWKLQKALAQRASFNTTLQMVHSVGFETKTSDDNVVVDIAQVRKDSDRNWTDKSKTGNYAKYVLKRAMLLLFSLLFISFGVFVVDFTFGHVYAAKAHCASISESQFSSNGTLSDLSPSDFERKTLSSNPELFVWDQCLYKVYPFTNDEQGR